LESETKKSPTFWNADLARKSRAFALCVFALKSRAFGNFAMKKTTFLESETKKSPTFWKAKQKKARLLESEEKKSPTFWDADLVRKSRAFGNFENKKPDLQKKARLFGMQIWFVKVGLLETLQKKSSACKKKPDFLDGRFSS